MFVLTKAKGSRLGDAFPRMRGLQFVDGNANPPDAFVVSCNAFSLADLADFVHRGDNCFAQSTGALWIFLVEAPHARDFWPAPPTVPPRSSKSSDVAFDYGDLTTGIGDRQVIGGPQPGEAGAQDNDIDIAIAGEWRARFGFESDAIEPVAC
jgi:hypothetical protein